MLEPDASRLKSVAIICFYSYDEKLYYSETLV